MGGTMRRRLVVIGWDVGTMFQELNAALSVAYDQISVKWRILVFWVRADSRRRDALAIFGFIVRGVDVVEGAFVDVRHVVCGCGGNGSWVPLGFGGFQGRGPRGQEDGCRRGPAQVAAVGAVPGRLRPVRRCNRSSRGVQNRGARTAKEPVCT